MLLNLLIFQYSPEEGQAALLYHKSNQVNWYSSPSNTYLRGGLLVRPLPDGASGFLLGQFGAVANGSCGVGTLIDFDIEYLRLDKPGIGCLQFYKEIRF